MSRSARLLDLLQALRRHRRPVTAATLAAELGVSLRTTYRDLATLKAGGAALEGEAGLGYVLREGFFLPPLMFGVEEADAIMLGLAMVQARGDPDFAQAAADALAKVAAVLPEEVGLSAGANGLLAGPSRGATVHLGAVRAALGRETKLRIGYVDKEGRETARVVWPVAIGFFEAAEVLAAWCEARRGYRHFRLDRIRSAEELTERLPRRRRLRLAEGRASEGL